MITMKGRIVGPEEIRTSTVTIDGERIVAVCEEPAKADKEYDYADCLVVPGFGGES